MANKNNSLPVLVRQAYLMGCAIALELLSGGILGMGGDRLQSYRMNALGCSITKVQIVEKNSQHWTAGMPIPPLPYFGGLLFRLSR